MQHDHILKKTNVIFYMGGFLAPGAEFEKNNFLIWSSGGHLFSGVEPFVQFRIRALSETIL